MEINNLGCFNANLLGTVADWVIVLITLAGTFYIALTFREQKRINAQQSEINRLSMEKDRREIRPYFKVFVSQNPFEETINLILMLENALAFEVMINYYSGGRYEVTGSDLYKSEWEINEKANIHLRRKTIDETHNDSISVATLKFKDEAGRAYQQNVTLSNRDLTASVPKQIPTYSIWAS